MPVDLPYVSIASTTLLLSNVSLATKTTKYLDYVQLVITIFIEKLKISISGKYSLMKKYSMKLIKQINNIILRQRNQLILLKNNLSEKANL